MLVHCPQSEVQRDTLLASLDSLLSSVVAPRILVIAATATLKPTLVHALTAYPSPGERYTMQSSLREPIAPGVYIASIREVQAAVRTPHPLSQDAFDGIVVCGTPPSPGLPMWRETLNHFAGISRICIGDSPDAVLAALGAS